MNIIKLIIDYDFVNGFSNDTDKYNKYERDNGCKRIQRGNTRYTYKDTSGQEIEIEDSGELQKYTFREESQEVVFASLDLVAGEVFSGVYTFIL